VQRQDDAGAEDRVQREQRDVHLVGHESSPVECKGR
jgi:hypothetical protein